MVSLGNNIDKKNNVITATVLKIASRCNLNCTYCYIYNHVDNTYLTKPKFMSDKVFLSTILEINHYYEANKLTKFSIIFHGGEPTLYEPKQLDVLLIKAQKILKGKNILFSIQTNATIMTIQWLKLIKKHRISVGISLDGTQNVNDSERKDHSGKGSYNNAIKGFNELKKHNIDSTILCVINPYYSGLNIYRHFISLGAKSVDFLIPDATHDSRFKLYQNLSDTPIADYLIPIFDEWFLNDHVDIYIRVFHDIIKRILGGISSSDTFGNGLMNYLMIETDGSIEAMDTLKICKNGISQSGLNIIDSGFDSLNQSSPLMYSLLYEGVKLSKTCLSCTLKENCAGGYLPHRYSDANQFDNPSVWCEDIKKLINHIRHCMNEKKFQKI